MWTQAKEHCGRLLYRIIPFYQAGGHLLWPDRCSICKVSILPSDEGLCQTCWQDLSRAVSADYCRRCGRDVSPYGIVQGKCGHCQDIQLGYDGVIRVGTYESTLRSMILSLKFSEKTEWAAPLAAMLRDAVTADHLCEKIDMLVPVPLHWRRRIKRGFNQSQLLAKRIKLPQIPVSTDLVRIRHTKQQWDLNPAQRRKNVKGAFNMTNPDVVRGKTILLVDDVATTGSTLNECSRVLKKAGCDEVFCLVLARTASV